jgi:hypothetical protein
LFVCWISAAPFCFAGCDIAFFFFIRYSASDTTRNNRIFIRSSYTCEKTKKKLFLLTEQLTCNTTKNNATIDRC